MNQNIDSVAQQFSDRRAFTAAGSTDRRRIISTDGDTKRTDQAFSSTDGPQTTAGDYLASE